MLIVDDFNNTGHDVREEDHSAKHVDNSHEDFSVADRVVISIANCCEGGHGVVPRDDDLSGDRHFVHFELVVEGGFLDHHSILWDLCCFELEHDQKPEAPAHKSTKDSHQEKTDDFESMHNHVLKHDFVLRAVVLKKRFEQVIETGNIKHFLNSCHTDESQEFIDTFKSPLWINYRFKWEDGAQIYQEWAPCEIVFSDECNFSNRLLSFSIFIFLEKVKNDVQQEHNFYKHIKMFQPASILILEANF